MRCFILLFLFFFMLVHLGLAQDFRKGYIRLQGEDKQGLIGQIVGSKPEAIQFKATDSSAVELYKADAIIGYYVGTNFYSAFLNPGVTIDWIFVDLMVQGELTLLRRGTMYFVLQSGSNKFTHLGDKYKRALTSLTSDCPWLSTKAGRVRFSREELTGFINDYNACVVSKRPNLEGMQRPVSVAMLAGYDYSEAKFSKETDIKTRFLTASKLRDKSFVQFGVDVTFKTHKVSKIVGMYIGALYNSNSYHSVSRLLTRQSSEVSEYSIDFTELKIPIGFELRAPSKKPLSVFVRTGVVFSKILAFESTHPTFEFQSRGDEVIQYMEPGEIISFNRNIMASATMGIDYRVLKASRIRLQGNASIGTVDVKIRSGELANTASGVFSSYNVMLGFVF